MDMTTCFELRGWRVTIRTFSIATALWLTTSLSTAAAQSITGRVVDGDTNTQIAAAEIMLIQIDSSSRTMSDARGAFRVRAIPGMWTLRVKALGYDDLITQPLQVAAGEHLSVVVMLTAKPLELPPVTVIARSNRALSALEEFEKRAKRKGFGYFMDRKAIERAPAMVTSDLLRRVPGALVAHDRVSFRGCEDATYLVDGMPVYGIGGNVPGDPGLTATEWVNSIVAPEDIAGIEVYRGDVGVPAELVTYAGRGTGSCGLVAIWTKR
jgi:hypothetical protein